MTPLEIAQSCKMNHLKIDKFYDVVTEYEDILLDKLQARCTKEDLATLDVVTELRDSIVLMFDKAIRKLSN